VEVLDSALLELVELDCEDDAAAELMEDALDGEHAPAPEKSCKHPGPQ
jgi:hypothetical protein